MPKRFLFMGIFALIIAVSAWFFAVKWQQQHQTVVTEDGVETVAGSVTPVGAKEKIKVVASLFPWYDLAKQIGGERVEVKLLLPPGVEAHAFEPTPSDLITVSQAKLFVYTGDYFETWAQDILDSLDGDAPKAEALGAGLATLTDKDEGAPAEEKTQNNQDPHIWLDPMLLSKAAGRLTQTLAALDPDNSAYYNQRLENYQKRLESLDADYRQTLSRCNQTEFIYAGHYAFGYLAARYGLKYEAAQGFSPDAESSPQRLTELTDLIKESQASSIFAEELDNPQLAAALAKENGVKILLLNSAHNLSKDDLKAGLTYEQIMRNNLEKLKLGLGCR